MAGMSDLLLMTLGLLVMVARCCDQPIAPQTFGLVKPSRPLPEPTPKSARPRGRGEAARPEQVFEPEWASATL